MEKIKIEITDDFDIFVTSKSRNQMSDKKLISIDDLYNILGECNGKRKSQKVKLDRDILYSSPLMPSFNGVHVLQHIIKNENTEIVVLQREARRSKVAFYDEVMEDVGMPSLIFAIYLTSGVIRAAKVMAVKDKLIKEDTKLYRYPLTNVGDMGSICFGGNNLREYSVNDGTFNNLHSFPNMFLMMPSTHEIRHQNNYKMELKPLLNHLKGKDFDNDKLFEANITYRAWINQHVE